MKKILKFGIYLVVLGFVFIGGMITQKYYGLGNVLKKLNPSYVPEKYEMHLNEHHQENLSIFILAGQSNMEGDGDIKEYNEELNKEGIYVFNENYKWVKGKEPVRKKVGPSISFASTLIENKAEYPVGIINVAAGGTNISQWLNNGDDNSLYKKMIKRALAGSTQGKIKGLLFFQGENDAEGDDADHLDNWNVKFEEFVSSVRQDLELDSLPIIFAQIGKGDSVNWNKVKASQEKVDIPFVSMIKTDDIDYREEGNIHFSTKGYIEIGKRFALNYIEKYKSTPLEKKEKN